MEPENKEGFINDLNLLLIKHGGGRYDFLKSTPLVYTKIISGETGNVMGEIVTCGGKCANVHIDTLPAMMADIYKQGVI